MKIEASKQCRQAGFSLIEMLITVAIIMIMAAVALPNISQYLRTYNIRGGSQAFAGEVQAARSKGIMGNTNAGALPPRSSPPALMSTRRDTWARAIAPNAWDETVVALRIFT